MNTEQEVRARDELIAEFERLQNRTDGTRVVGSLADGLSLLRDTLFTRIHRDVEAVFGTDSMLIPLSEKGSRSTATTEIEIFQIAETAAAVREGHHVAEDQHPWLMDWLTRLRLGDEVSAGIRERIESYPADKLIDRRRMFSRRIERVFPEAAQAPLVVYRLFPLSLAIAASIAFGDGPRAGELRRQQVTILPNIADCHACHGRLLENGEKCPQCGNPLWTYEWLVAE